MSTYHSEISNWRGNCPSWNKGQVTHLKWHGSSKWIATRSFWCSSDKIITLKVMEMMEYLHISRNTESWVCIDWHSKWSQVQVKFYFFHLEEIMFRYTPAQGIQQAFWIVLTFHLHYGPDLNPISIWPRGGNMLLWSSIDKFIDVVYHLNCIGLRDFGRKHCKSTVSLSLLLSSQFTKAIVILMKWDVVSLKYNKKLHHLYLPHWFISTCFSLISPLSLSKYAFVISYNCFFRMCHSISLALP